MKKVLIVLAVLLAVSTVLGAQSFNAKGGVTAAWGMDLDNGTSGFDVYLDNLDFTAAIGDPKSIEKVSDDDVYGEIIIKNLRVSTLDADASSAATDNNALTTPFNPGNWGFEALAVRWDTLAARLVFGENFAVGIWGYDTAYESYSRRGGLDTNWGFLKNAYDYYLFDGSYGSDNVTAAQYNSWDATNGSPNNRVYFLPHSFVYSAFTKNDGITLNLSIPQVLDFAMYVDSWKKWDATDRFSEIGGAELPEGDNAYVLTPMVALTAVENLTFKLLGKFDLGVPVLASGGAAAPAFAALASYKIAIGEDISITPAVAFDGQIGDYDGFTGSAYSAESSDGFDWGLAAGLNVGLKNTTLAVNFGMGSNSNEDDADVAGDESFTSNSMNLTASLSFGLVEGLMVKAAFEYIDPVSAYTAAGVAAAADTIDEDETIGVAAELSYDIKVSEKGALTPYVKFSMDNKEDYDNYAMYMKVGASAKGVMENTTLFLEWASNDLSGVEVYSTGEVIGQIKLGTTISF